MRAVCGLVLTVALICLLPLAARAADPSAPERLPVPNSAAQGKIVSSIRTQYHDDYARRTAADQLALAQKFREQASLANEDPVRQYVLLREARELATNSGNLDAAFGIVDDTARLFAVEGDELKVTVMSNAMDRALIPKSELLENYLRVSDTALSRADLTLASHSIPLATQIARATRDRTVMARVRSYELRLHDARREVTVVIAANEKLKANPEDAESALIVGRYVCFAQGNWEGLSILARGSDKRLRDLAEQDLATPIDPNSKADLANAWWDLPDSKQTPQKLSRQRAVHWYEEALPGLNGEKKLQAEQRIAELHPGKSN
jgi:hypothetical protein